MNISSVIKRLILFVGFLIKLRCIALKVSIQSCTSGTTQSLKKPGRRIVRSSHIVYGMSPEKMFRFGTQMELKTSKRTLARGWIWCQAEITIPIGFMLQVNIDESKKFMISIHISLWDIKLDLKRGYFFHYRS